MQADVDVFRYHDLTRRLAVFSRDGGGYLRGDTQSLLVDQGEPVMERGEIELARLAGVVALTGSRCTAQSSVPTLGLVLEGSSILIATSERLILVAVGGCGQLGPVHDDEVHTFVLPWDLVSSVSMPARRSVADRIAGARPIEVLDHMTGTSITLRPARTAEIGGIEQRVSDDEVMELLVGVAGTHRLSVSPAYDRDRVQRVLDGTRGVTGGEKVALLSPDDGADIPPHLEGRLARDPWRG